MSAQALDIRSVDGVTVITLNRPDKRNAMTSAMCSDLAQAWQRFRDGDDRAAVLTGAGTAFCAGADLSDPPPHFWRALPEVGIDIGKPVIAAVRGPAVGFGLAMVVFSDMAVAARDASFIYPEARLGISKGLMAALTVRVPQKIAHEVMLLGEPLGAQRAYETGLVNRLVEPGEELDTAMQIARSMTRAAPRVVKLLKQLSRETLPMTPIEAAYRAQLATDTVEFSEDAQAGLAAFRDKRAPVFTGR